LKKEKKKGTGWEPLLDTKKAKSLRKEEEAKKKGTP